MGIALFAREASTYYDWSLSMRRLNWIISTLYNISNVFYLYEDLYQKDNKILNINSNLGKGLFPTFPAIKLYIHTLYALKVSVTSIIKTLQVRLYIV